MDYEKIIHTIVDPFLINPDALMVRVMPSENDKDVVLLICAEGEDTARLTQFLQDEMTPLLTQIDGVSQVSIGVRTPK